MFATVLVEPAQYGAGKVAISHVELLTVNLSQNVWKVRCSLWVVDWPRTPVFRHAGQSTRGIPTCVGMTSFLSLIVLINLAAEQATQAIFHALVIVAAQPLAGSLFQLALLFFQALLGAGFFLFEFLLCTCPLFLQLLAVALLQLEFRVLRYQILHAFTVKAAIAQRTDLGQRAATAQQRQAAIDPVVAWHLATLGAGGLAAQAHGQGKVILLRLEIQLPQHPQSQLAHARLEGFNAQHLLGHGGTA